MLQGLQVTVKRVNHKPMKEKQSPAQFVIRILGGVRPISRELGIHASTVSRWKMGHGRVPQKYWKPLIEIAKERKKKITIENLAGLD